MAREATNTKKA